MEGDPLSRRSNKNLKLNMVYRGRFFTKFRVYSLEFIDLLVRLNFYILFKYRIHLKYKLKM